MAKPVSKTVIGGFVISAIALLIIGIVVFGGGRFFVKSVKFALFFDHSVKGLNEGAAVVFRGVKIGSVESVAIRADTEKLIVDIPVIIELEPERFQLKTEDVQILDRPFERAKVLIERGLRARLAVESLVTGQLMVEFDFLPDSPVRLRGIDTGYPELPTLPSQLDKLRETLGKIPVEEIVEQLLSALGHLDEILGAPEVMDTLGNLAAATENANQMIIHLDRQIDPLSAGLQGTMGDARKLMQDVDGEIKPLSAKTQAALVSAKAALDQIAGTLQTYEGLVAERSELRNDLSVALNEIAKAAHSIRVLTDYLEQHPEALLQGKGSGGRQ